MQRWGIASDHFKVKYPYRLQPEDGCLDTSIEFHEREIHRVSQCVARDGEDGDWAGYSNNAQWLSSKDGEDRPRQEGGEYHLQTAA